MAALYPFKITTLVGVRFEGEVESVTAPGVEGEVGVLANHAPMVCATRKGRVSVRQGERTSHFEVDEGTFEVKEHSAVLLVGFADEIT